MTNNTMVFWHTRRLAKEFGITPSQVGVILSSIGAKRWNAPRGGGSGSIWYWDVTE